MSSRDTIFAPATARGRAAIAVIRVSGPLADVALAQLAGAPPEPRRAVVRLVRDSAGEVIDQCLVLRFAPGESFTGEASFELQCHGGQAVTASLLRSLGAIAGLRLALPGEFTRRAVEAGRLDLPAAEALADLAAAETEAQRRLAMRGLRGELSAAVLQWRGDLIKSRALVEASIDFADEDIPAVLGDVQTLVGRLAGSLRSAIAGAAAGERVREGFEVALIGAPNAGKSSLLNALAKREAALTSEIAGTTRDVIEVRMDFDGLAVTLLDTAGLRESVEAVEAMGIARGRERAAAADLRLFLQAPDDPPPGPDTLCDGDLIVATKADLRHDGGGVSVVTGVGMDALIHAVTEKLQAKAAGASLVVRERQRCAVATGLAHIDTALALLRLGDAALELVAEELRLAVAALDSLIGTVDMEDVLDDIFASFCLGK